MAQIERLDVSVLVAELTKASTEIEIIVPQRDAMEGRRLGSNVNVQSLRILQENLRELVRRKTEPFVTVCAYILIGAVEDVFENVFGDIPFTRATDSLRVRVAEIFKSRLARIAEKFNGLASVGHRGREAGFSDEICAELDRILADIRMEKASHIALDFHEQESGLVLNTEKEDQAV